MSLNFVPSPVQVEVLLDALNVASASAMENGHTELANSQKRLRLLILDSTQGQAEQDMRYLVEAYRFGQFADDMLDHPSPDCRSLTKPLREALRRHLDWLERVS